MFDQQVDNCIGIFFDIEEVIVQPFPTLPYGRKVIDHAGDYMVFFYNVETANVIYFLKETEECCFRGERISFASCGGIR